MADAPMPKFYCHNRAPWLVTLAEVGCRLIRALARPLWKRSQCMVSAGVQARDLQKKRRLVANAWYVQHRHITACDLPLNKREGHVVEAGWVRA